MSALLFLKARKSFILLIFSCLSIISYAQEARYLEEINIKPQQLEYFRDSVRFSIDGKISIESVMSPRNPELKLLLKTSDKSLDLGDFELQKNLGDYSFSKDFVLEFEPWMEGAILEAQLFQGKKVSDEPFETVQLAKGVITTPFLAKIGRVNPDEPIPNIGLYIPAGIVNRDLTKTKEFQIFFNPGTSNYVGSSRNEAMLSEIRAFLMENPSITSIKIIGIQSPEQAEGKNSKLGMDRAMTVKDELISRKLFLRDSIIEVGARWNDWFDLRLLIRDYAGLSTSKKDEYYTILMNGDDYLSQRSQMEKIAGFSQLSRQLFPQLRMAKIEIQAKPGSGLGIEKMSILEKELKGNSSNSELTFQDWASAAETSPSLDDKAEIYTKMTEMFRSSLPYNNLAVVKIQEAQRTLDRDLKENLWAEAEWLLNQALRLEESAYILHNLGQIYALKGEYWTAYKYLSDASVLTRDPDFLMRNESLRGALDIIRGDYKLATLRFDYPFSNSFDFFNKGLASFLSKDYASASLAFEESVMRDRGFGYGYYGLALIAINSGQNEVALIQLEKAVNASEVLYEKSLVDPSFDDIKSDPKFFEILRKK
ncbi:outer membrane protein OmpA-like peptidoglycan-associated protein [Algoriphagus zhangzhouensis]|uniref:Outer membrane protein OmpA n=2 Tax=Algoriphagus zhangzhouensis TaxID=1073327 RepID=A0A1M7ZJJ0_9BACT|nr:outer membrane protein OmpA-like peptidoglycan-associated protein [Algoriphagus zhangzhouensis]SHO65058.1 Outer membrane protein OmpA [Algoriphagus zhangzhouensis]